MALVNNITKRLEIPHESGEWMEIKKLSWAQLEAASDVASMAALERIGKMGGDVIAAIKGATVDQERAPGSEYDKAAVLKSGILRWSYDAKVTTDTINQLDKETADWAFEQILGLNKPRTEEETKNA